MSRKGDCWDNAVAESFFATIKGELIDRNDYLTRSAASDAIGDYIDGFYNLTRRHSALDYVSPIEFELNFALDGFGRMSIGKTKHRSRVRKAHSRTHWAARTPGEAPFEGLDAVDGALSRCPWLFFGWSVVRKAHRCARPIDGRFAAADGPLRRRGRDGPALWEVDRGRRRSSRARRLRPRFGVRGDRVGIADRTDHAHAPSAVGAAKGVDAPRPSTSASPVSPTRA